MSGDIFQLKGTAGGAGNGYWTVDTTNDAPAAFTNLSGINFTFQRFTVSPNKVKLTWSGTGTWANATAGIASVWSAYIPIAALPSWALPILPVELSNPPTATQAAGVGSGPAILQDVQGWTNGSLTVGRAPDYLVLILAGVPGTTFAGTVNFTSYNVVEYYID